MIRHNEREVRGYHKRVSVEAIGGNGLKMLLLSLIVVGLTGGVSWLALTFWLWWRARRYPHAVAGGRALLVPGVRLKACAPNADFRVRLERAAVLWRTQRRPVAILGGRTSPECEQSEASAGRDYLFGCGVDAQDLLVEERSRHTLENLRFARDLFGASEALVVVSNRYHLPRLCIMARRLGMRLLPCAAEERGGLGFRATGRLIREAFFVHWYLAGLGWALAVGDEASLNRIS